MEILVIGGTRFVGRHFVEAAQARGHKITLFHRGQSGDDLFPDLETIHGDRETDLGRLKGRRWHTVVDTCGYVPRVVRLSTEALRAQVDHYAFISTISVYADPVRAGSDEDAPLQTLDDPTSENVGAHYGALKARCEQAVDAAFPARSLLVRPGMIVGPCDPTDRFTAYVARAARGGEMLIPASPASPVQIIDARDLAAWLVLALEQRLTGAYNLVGPTAPITYADWMAACTQAAGRQPTLRYVEPDLLEQLGATAQELPFALSQQDSGIFALSFHRASAAGLVTRPLIEIVRDTLAWHRARGEGYILRAGLTPEREAELLAAL